MKSQFLKALHRFAKNKRRKFFIWLSESCLDFENRWMETRARNFILRKYVGVRIGTNTIIDSNFEVGENVTIGNNVLIRENCRIESDVVIEDNVTLSRGVQLITSGHAPFTMEYVHKPIIIHKGAWIAANAILLPGAIIGEGAVVAAGAVVTKDIPPHTLAGGVPARFIKER